ncbi:nucleotide-binding protein [Cerasicoccus fimbriatus]|uniref:nucleotide-binding protein n=1 Tax=Cerasicoccus fimbriatus TaxID=3014554 RepID=UPI0022B54884|nr:nucleotide-binding protein [Cerasicoccus sp. TK19100]
MYNLLVAYGNDYWEKSPATIPKERFLEYTDEITKDRFKKLTQELIDEIKEFPTLFMCEGEKSPTIIGRITDIKVREAELRIYFEESEHLSRIETGLIAEHATALDIYDFEMNRTHWAIKDEDLYHELTRANIISKEQLSQENQESGSQIENIPPEVGNKFNNDQIFIVHGHEDLAKNDVKNFVTSLEKEPIILHLQASGGMTIIEKIDYYSNVGFAIVLYTECDVGAKRNSLVFKRRARQNVVFEHGYLIGKIGRSRVVALVKGDVETPNDVSGVVYVKMDKEENWKVEIKKELLSCGYIKTTSKP